MGLIWIALAAISVWALVRLGRQGEKAGRRHWRVTATLFSACLLGAAVLLAARSSWLLAGILGGAGLWLTVASRLDGTPRRLIEPKSEDMTLTEARAMLGVAPGATPEQINAAWRRLMARAHPDQGGTEGMAARLNAARDRMLKG